MSLIPASALIEISETEGAQQPRTENAWYWYIDGDESGAIPFNINTLYRGQNQRYLPFRPAIARGLASDTGKMCDMLPVDQAQLVLRVAQSWWFARELDHHPITSHAKAQRVKLDRIALAQHYGVPTGYLDLTDNFDIAAFFATCKPADGGWKPMESGKGIIYRLDLRDPRGPFDWIQPLGPQPLPRPSEQKAWVAEIPLHHSFDGWPMVFAIEFEHDRAVGEHFLEIFGGGEILFPPDPLDTIASEICDSKQIPFELVENVLKQFSEQDKFGPRADQFSAIRKEIQALAELIDYRRLLHDTQLAPFLADFEWRKLRLSDIKAHTRPMALEIRPPSKEKEP